ncbi:hypothetical protein M406DRAFT_65917 [Cryphonectria parasitica EP155]|uniref:Uncharacterized protein n=1 Tax=Cryphonectria parasitica (strain ATCC 38755 / EP155) TaxID=660469 RepID=A0A9P4Y9F8_CRYP1|nr:uncharacterized protein M406DRAFT_65917 [Cryphonectria parasitica EP155]KAF3769419.1 hypothetical protein M406DRAFT_65917 [Cryphonectria parasitica EP155]
MAIRKFIASCAAFSKSWSPYIIKKQSSEDVERTILNLTRLQQFRHPRGESSRPQGKVLLKREFPWIECVLHVIAVASTATVTYINLAAVYWADEGNWRPQWFLGNLGQQNSLKALTFAAQLYSILVTASLSSVVLYFVRRRLVGREGLPFGLLVGAYSLSNLSYLFQWGGYCIRKAWNITVRRNIPKPSAYSSWGKNHDTTSTAMIGLMIGIVIVLSLVVNPLANVAIVPTLQWWHVDQPYDDFKMPLYFNTTASAMYPLRVTGDVWNATCAEWSIATSYNGKSCPGAGLWELYEWLAGQSDEESNGIVNTTITEFEGHAQRALTAVTGGWKSSDSGSITVVLTLPHLILKAFGLLWVFIQTWENFKISQPLFSASQTANVLLPLVQVQCAYYDYNSTASDSYADVAFERYNLLDSLGDCQNESSNNELIVPEEYWNFPKPLGSTNFTWIDVKGNGSIGALFTVPSLSKNDTIISDASPPSVQYGGPFSNTGSGLVPCIVDARWAGGASLQYDPVNSALVSSNPADGWSFFGDTPNSSFPANCVKFLGSISNRITIDLSFAHLLNLGGYGKEQSFGSRSLNISSMEALMLPYIHNSSHGPWFLPPDWEQDWPAAGVSTSSGSYGEQVAETISRVLGLVIADGLARVSYNADVFVSHYGGDLLSDLHPNRGNYSDMNITTSQSTTLSLNVSRYGWGYGTSASLLIPVAITVLLAYAVMILLYWIYRMRSWWGTDSDKGGWTSKAWGDLSGLLRLILLSDEAKDLLQKGDSGEALWLTRFVVRERMEDEDRLHMVMVNDEDDGDLANIMPRQIELRFWCSFVNIRAADRFPISEMAAMQAGRQVEMEHL